MKNKSKTTVLFFNPASKVIALKESSSAAVFEMLNQRWTLMVLRELSRGRQRFNELSKRAHINPNTLRDRLREMESLGIINREVISSIPPNVEYFLTDKGTELCRVFQTFDEWVRKYAVVEMEAVPKRKPKAGQSVSKS
jgi:DNA-binding HxlR family transcriptional regulator